MTVAVDITDGRGFSNEAHCELLPGYSCTLLTRWSTSVLKWACHASCEAYKRRLAYSVTVRILAQNNF